jgi:hypothetical protein
VQQVKRGGAAQMHSHISRSLLGTNLDHHTHNTQLPIQSPNTTCSNITTITTLNPPLPSNQDLLPLPLLSAILPFLTLTLSPGPAHLVLHDICPLHLPLLEAVLQLLPGTAPRQVVNHHLHGVTRNTT